MAAVNISSKKAQRAALGWRVRAMAPLMAFVALTGAGQFGADGVCGRPACHWQFDKPDYRARFRRRLADLAQPGWPTKTASTAVTSRRCRLCGRRSSSEAAPFAVEGITLQPRYGGSWCLRRSTEAGMPRLGCWVFLSWLGWLTAPGALARCRRGCAVSHRPKIAYRRSSRCLRG